jgi:hypothetical protein
MTPYHPYFDRDEIWFEIEKTNAEGGGRMGVAHEIAGSAIMAAWEYLRTLTSIDALLVTEVHRRKGSSSTIHRPAFEVRNDHKTGSSVITVSDLTLNWNGED